MDEVDDRNHAWKIVIVAGFSLSGTSFPAGRESRRFVCPAFPKRLGFADAGCVFGRNFVGCAGLGFAPQPGVKSVVAPDQLFSALDGAQLSVDGSAWRVEVFGVIDEPDRRWLQVALDGAERSIVTVRLDHSASAGQVVEQLSTWIHDPQAVTNVLQHVA